jgi:hypothetical protein
MAILVVFFINVGANLAAILNLNTTQSSELS